MKETYLAALARRGSAAGHCIKRVPLFPPPPTVFPGALRAQDSAHNNSGRGGLPIAGYGTSVGAVAARRATGARRTAGNHHQRTGFPGILQTGECQPGWVSCGLQARCLGQRYSKNERGIMKKQSVRSIFLARALLAFLVAFGWINTSTAGAPVFEAPAGNQIGVWKEVGLAGFSAGQVDRPTLAVDGNGIPYVAYRDAANANKATVMKHDGSDWVTVGAAGFSAGQVRYTSIAIDDSNTPYVAYEDSANSSKATVMKFNGSNWVPVGSAGFSPGDASETSIAIHGNTPYVLYNYSDPASEESNLAVMKFNGSSWVTVGSADFTAGEAYDSSFAIDDNGTPYVMYVDVANSDKATVMKFNGSSWVTVGSAGFSPDYVGEYTDIAIDPGGTPYVVYEDGADGDARKATVMKFDGNSWVVVGSAGFTADEAHIPSIAIDSQGTPYVAFGDYAESEKLTVMKYNGSSWVIVDQAGFTDGYIFTPSIAIDGNDDPLVAYEDWGNSGKVSVMKAIDGFQYQIAENTTAVGTIHASDPDSDPITYGISISQGNSATNFPPDFPPDPGDPNADNSDGDGAYFYLDGGTGELRFVLAPDFDIPADTDGDNLYEFTVTASANGDDVSTTVRVAITNVQEGPKFQFQPAWSTLGPAGFSYRISSSPFLALDGSNTPYMVYRATYQGQVAVQKFNVGTWEWEYVGPEFNYVDGWGISAHSVTETSMAFDSADSPYIVYRDEDDFNRLTVKRYVGESWGTVGAEGFTATSPDFKYLNPAIVIDSTDTPHVVYCDAANSFKATVMKFNGSAWVTVGPAGFTAGPITPTIGSYIDIGFDSGDTPYVVFRDEANSNKATVMKFNGSSWETVGSAGFSSDQVEHTTVAIDGNDTVYVAYDGWSTYSYTYQSTVMRYNGTDWVTVGQPRFSSIDARWTSLAMDSHDIPHVVFAEKYPGGTTVMKYDDGDWGVVGEAGFSAGSAQYPSIAFDDRDIPYVGFWDLANGGKATVMRAVPGHLFYQIQENTTAVGSIHGIDPENESVTYSISGFDSAYLSIDATSGVLSFRTAPDFENPQDANADNLYAFTATISAGGDEASSSGYVNVYNDPNDTSIEYFIDAAPVVVGNQFAFTVTGAVDSVVFVEACTDLSANPVVWEIVDTLTLTGGSASFSDPDWAVYPSRFYRLRLQ